LTKVVYGVSHLFFMAQRDWAKWPTG